MRHLLLLILPILASCGKSGETVSPARRDLVQAVYASGKIFPVNGYKVYSKLPGYVEKIHVHVGDSVRIGQPLITIKSEISELNVNTAKNLYELAQKNASDNSPLLTSLKQDVGATRSKYELDSANFSRFSNLYKDNATSKAQFDQAKTQFDISRQNFLKSLYNYNATRDRLRTELENAKIQYDAQVSNRNDYTLVSVVNGKVYDIVPKEGELVGTQISLLEIGDASSYYAELSVDETDIALVKEGQEIVFTIDAYKDVTFKGQIMEVYPRISQTNKTSKVVASIILPDDLMILSGMSAEANIIIAKRTATLVVPREFLLAGRKVIMESGDTIEIEKGAEDLQFVEILKGLDETSVIIKP